MRRRGFDAEYLYGAFGFMLGFCNVYAKEQGDGIRARVVAITLAICGLAAAVPKPTPRQQDFIVNGVIGGIFASGAYFGVMRDRTAKEHAELFVQEFNN